jgi:protocatechuate 3,4-dioxygenase beta subunit
MDTKTPAENVILYVYHTNSEGIYETKGNEKGWGKRHGYIRGWIKTGKDGKYTFYTSRPAAYPNTDEPEHIHITVKEPKRNEYYIDAVVFSDDELLTSENKKALTNRGGSGIVTPVNENGILTVNRDIILGLNIPNYE